MSIIHCIREKKFIPLEISVFESQKLSLAAKGAYAMIECEAIQIEDIPRKIINELIEFGYLTEEKE